MTTLAIRADALPGTGLGHLTRCLALAHAARASGWCVHGIGRIADPSVRARARENLDGWRDLPTSHPDPADLSATLAALADIAPDWVVLDGYAFDTAYQRALRARARLLVLDDGPRLERYAADLLLDQNLGAEARNYVLEGEGACLLGSEYILLRPTFLGARAADRGHSVRRLLVTLGGVVEGPALEAVLAGLALVASPLDVTLLTGTDPATLELARRIAPGQHRWNLLPWHDDMPVLMAATDLAIAAAGSTSWELAFMGVPTLLVALADNQAGIATALDAAGAAINLGVCDDGYAQRLAGELDRLLGDPSRRERLSGQARALVDGRGAERVLEEMRCK